MAESKDSTKARLKQAEAEIKRLRGVIANGITSEGQWVEKVGELRHQIMDLEARLDWMTIELARFRPVAVEDYWGDYGHDIIDWPPDKPDPDNWIQWERLYQRDDCGEEHQK